MPLQYSPFLERLIRFLIPFFIGVTPDLDAARAEILETLASYGARTRAEMLNAAQIVAYGLSGLEMLGEAKAPTMSSSLRLRFRACANGLNRAGQQNEKALAKRLTCDLPDAAEPGAEPVNDVPDADVLEITQQAQAKIDSYRNRLSGARPATSPQAIPAAQPNGNKRLWGEAMMDALAQMGAPAQPAAAA
jgi:hypothetical protein